MLAPWFRTMLVPLVLPRLDGVVAKLEAGTKVADVGCGTGVALIEMAKAFPRSAFHGYEISQHALAQANENKRSAGVDQRHVPRRQLAMRLPGDASFGLITAFDCLHDMTHPAQALQAMRRSLQPDGTCLIVDINARPTFEENLQRQSDGRDDVRLLRTECMSSALSHPEGAGLGTLGFSEPVARQMAAEAGFTRFRRHDFDNPVNAYYEVRP